MATTTNKGYELIVTGTETNTWGDKLNTDVFTRVDDNMGGVVTKSLTNVQVDLSAAESRMLRLVLNGTLTGNVLVTTLAIGMTIIENACTGNFTVTFQKFGVGTPVTVPNGTNVLVTTGASGNPSTIGVDFPTGTRMAFQQTTPPAGWIKDTTTSGLNNSAMRIVTGSVVNGGTADFSTTFASRTPAGTVGDTALSTSQIPSHQHFEFNTDTVVTTGTNLNNGTYPVQFSGSAGSAAYAISGSATVSTVGLTSPTGGSQVHAHSFTGIAMDFAVKYFDFSIGVKV
jgi:hypothetical protein